MRRVASTAISSSPTPASPARSPSPTQPCETEPPVSLYDSVRDLPLTVESYALDGLEQQVSSGFLRKTSLIRLSGDGEEGVGEDVTYEAAEHDLQQARGADPPARAETGHSTRSRSISRRCLSSITSRSSTPISTTAVGPSRAPHSTSHSARRDGHSLLPSGGRPNRSPSSSRCVSESRRRPIDCARGSASIPVCASSSTQRPTGRKS